MNEPKVIQTEGGLPGTPWFIKTSAFISVLADHITNKLGRKMTAQPVVYDVDGIRYMECHFQNLELVFKEDQPVWSLFVTTPDDLLSYQLEYDIVHTHKVLKSLNE